MITRIQKWGNSLSIRIPKPFAVEIGLEENTPVEISVEDGRLVLTPAVLDEMSLEDLLAGITPENLHGEFDLSDPVGTELM